MSVDTATIKALIQAELERICDERVVSFIRQHLIEPLPMMVSWDYGSPGQQYQCWLVLAESGSSVGIAYCEHGFGPIHPWGLLFVQDGRPVGSMGQDSGWFATFVDAAYDSVLSGLPIWRVFKTDASGRHPISAEGGWDETWKRVMSLREADPDHPYDCDASIELHKA